jgi:hypothetical protein
MLSFEQVMLIKKSYSPMCEDNDFYAQYALLEECKPENIIECGVGSGAWINAMNDCLSYRAMFVGVENFCSAYLEQDYYGQLPQNPKQLYNNVDIENFEHFYTTWEAVRKYPPGAVRIDMNFYWQPEVDDLLSGAKCVFVDDYKKPDYNKRIDQVLKAPGQFQLVYSGNQEAILTSTE